MNKTVYIPLMTDERTDEETLMFDSATDDKRWALAKVKLLRETSSGVKIELAELTISGIVEE